MREPESPKPRPARPPDVEPPAAGVKPTPVRELAGADAREPAPRGPSADEGRPTSEPDVAEVELEAEGGVWQVTVLGRSGGSQGRAPPLLLLGFRRAEGGAGDAAREATVVAHALSDLTPARLEAALGEALPPPATDRKKPFFEGASQGRRGGGSRGDA
jgi:hypothetical protein